MRITSLAGRLVLAGYLAVHGAQKLFGAFGGILASAGGEAFRLTARSPAAGHARHGGGPAHLDTVAYHEEERSPRQVRSPMRPGRFGGRQPR